MIGDRHVIPVTQEHLDGGSPGIAEACPIAWALAEYFGEPLWNWSVGGLYIFRKSGGFIAAAYWADEAGRRLMRLVDAGEKPAPTTITITEVAF